MTTTPDVPPNGGALPHPPSLRGPGAASQSTLIEGQRATAEVLGAIMAAHQVPRITARAVAAMEEACAIPELAARAFWNFPRSGQTLTGPSVHLARELARCWGNVDYGIKELSRDDAGGSSEMLAFAIDLETNVRVSTSFIVPHLRESTDRKTRARIVTRLEDTRDIYELNANLGARRVREMVFALLPSWFTARAMNICRWTNENGGGVPLAQRISEVLRRFENLGVNRQRLEARVGVPVGEWTGQEVAALGVLAESIEGNETTVADEFPRDRGGDAPAEPAGAKPGKPRAKPKPADTDAADAAAGESAPPAGPQYRTAAPGKEASGRMVGYLHALFADGGVPGDDGKLFLATRLLDLPVMLGSLKHLTTTEAAKLINQLKAWADEGPEGDMTVLATELGKLLPGEDDPGWADVDRARDAHRAAEGDQ